MLDQEFKRIGKRLFDEGLVVGNFGNVSTRTADGFYITGTGRYLDDPGNPVFVPFDGPVPKEASNEYRVHREVYRRSRHQAIVHAHPAYAVAASLVCDEIIPRDCGGEHFCPVIPVVHGKPGSDEIAMNVAEALLLTNLTIVSGHGTFAAGKTLDEGFVYTSLAEHACRVLWLLNRFSRS